MTLNFINDQHEKFYLVNGADGDSYRKSLIYLIGLTEDTRNHFTAILDSEGINRSVLNEGWVTDETRRLLVLGFNLWNGFFYGYSNPKYDEKSLGDLSKQELIEMVQEGFRNSISELFDGQLAYYYLQAIDLRFNVTKAEESRQLFERQTEKIFQNILIEKLLKAEKEFPAYAIEKALKETGRPVTRTTISNLRTGKADINKASRETVNNLYYFAKSHEEKLQ